MSNAAIAVDVFEATAECIEYTKTTHVSSASPAIGDLLWQVGSEPKVSIALALGASVKLPATSPEINWTTSLSAEGGLVIRCDQVTIY